MGVSAYSSPPCMAVERDSPYMKRPWLTGPASRLKPASQLQVWRGGSLGPGVTASTTEKASPANTRRRVTNTRGSNEAVARLAARCVPAATTVCTSSATSTRGGKRWVTGSM
jgi:hypothetical protein